MNVTVLAGGVGAARFLRGLLEVASPSTVTAVVNVGDDLVTGGLHVSPDLDTVTYTLAGAIDPERGWGLVGESWAAMDALERFVPVRPAGSQAAATWFRLGDQDLATHLYRTQRLDEGATLSTVTAEIASAWGLELNLLPATDDPLRTRVTIVDPDAEREVAFQDYFVGRAHAVAVRSVRFVGAERARPAPGVEEALGVADVIVIAPSNPLVSIGPILAVEPVRATLARHRDKVIAVSPIVAGAALKGPAARMLAELDHEPSVVGVARLYADLAGALVIDQTDEERADEVRAAGIRPVVTDTVMRDVATAAALARTTLGAVVGP